MDDKVQLISDGDGLAVLGKAAAVERFLDSLGLLPGSRPLGSSSVGSALRVGAGVAQGLSKTATSAGRWVRLTPDSARAVQDFGLVETSTPGVSYAMAGRPGAISSWLQIETGPSAALTNPAVLAGAAGLMAQFAVQHEMAQIKSYLASIDSKVDDVLRAQADAEVAKVIGAGADIEDAMTVLERQGQVDDDTWSLVQGRQQVITDAQMWAVRRLGSLARKAEHDSKLSTLVTALTQAESEVSDLLAVLARCVELQDGLDAIRLSRFSGTSPASLDAQRLVLRDGRQRRRALVLEAVEDLMARLDAAAEVAKARTLLHGRSSRSAVRSANGIGETVGAFSQLLEPEAVRVPLEGMRWRDAARDSRQLRSAGAEVTGGAVVAGVATLGAVVARAAMKGKSG